MAKLRAQSISIALNGNIQSLCGSVLLAIKKGNRQREKRRGEGEGREGRIKTNMIRREK